MLVCWLTVLSELLVNEAVLVFSALLLGFGFGLRHSIVPSEWNFGTGSSQGLNFPPFSVLIHIGKGSDASMV